MQWIWKFTGRKPRLEQWASRPFTAGAEDGQQPNDRRDTYECIVAHEPPGPPLSGGPHRRLADAILRFEIFPPQWVDRVVRRAPIQTGDDVGVCVHFLPGLDLFCASRVIDVFDDDSDGIWKTGFTYRTLQGHPLCGEETFSVEKNMETGDVCGALRSWSRPAIWSARVGKPVLRWLQVRVSRGALRRMQSIAEATESVSAALTR